MFQTLIEQGVTAGEFPPQNAATGASCLAGACFEGLVGPLSPEAITTPEDAETLRAAITAFCLRAVAGGRGAEVVAFPGKPPPA